MVGAVYMKTIISETVFDHDCNSSLKIYSIGMDELHVSVDYTFMQTPIIQNKLHTTPLYQHHSEMPVALACMDQWLIKPTQIDIHKDTHTNTDTRPIQ